MYVVVFQVKPKPGQAEEYLRIAKELRPELDRIDGFISIERFESVYEPGKYVSLSFWRDEEAIRAWRGHLEHQLAQRRGREEIFEDYNLSVAAVERNYGMFDREQAPHPIEAYWGAKQ